MVFLTQMISCLHVYPQTTELAGQPRGIRGLTEYLVAESAASEGKKCVGINIAIAIH